VEEMVQNEQPSQLKGKHVQVTDERGNLRYKVSLLDEMHVSRKLNGARLDRV
jgi:hypothetical protein